MHSRESIRKQWLLLRPLQVVIQLPLRLGGQRALERRTSRIWCKNMRARNAREKREAAQKTRLGESTRTSSFRTVEICYKKRMLKPIFPFPVANEGTIFDVFLFGDLRGISGQRNKVTNAQATETSYWSQCPVQEALDGQGSSGTHPTNSSRVSIDVVRWLWLSRRRGRATRKWGLAIFCILVCGS